MCCAVTGLPGLEDPEVNTACYSVIQSMVQQFPAQCAAVLEQIYATVTASLQEKGIENLLDDVEVEDEGGEGELATCVPPLPRPFSAHVSTANEHP